MSIKPPDSSSIPQQPSEINGDKSRANLGKNIKSLAEKISKEAKELLNKIFYLESKETKSDVDVIQIDAMKGKLMERLITKMEKLSDTDKKDEVLSNVTTLKNTKGKGREVLEANPDLEERINALYEKLKRGQS